MNEYIQVMYYICVPHGTPSQIKVTTNRTVSLVSFVGDLVILLGPNGPISCYKHLLYPGLKALRAQ